MVPCPEENFENSERHPENSAAHELKYNQNLNNCRSEKSVLKLLLCKCTSSVTYHLLWLQVETRKILVSKIFQRFGITTVC